MHSERVEEAVMGAVVVLQKRGQGGDGGWVDVRGELWKRGGWVGGSECC